MEKDGKLESQLNFSKDPFFINKGMNIRIMKPFNVNKEKYQ